MPLLTQRDLLCHSIDIHDMLQEFEFKLEVMHR